MAFERQCDEVVGLTARFAEVERADGREQAVVDLIGWLCRRDRRTLVELVAVALSAVDRDRLKELLVDDQDLAVEFVRDRLNELHTTAQAARPRPPEPAGSRHTTSPAVNGANAVDESGLIVALGGPNFVLRDIAAKRAILDVWEASRYDYDRPHPLTVRLPYLLASAWTGHRAYHQSWGY